MKKLLIAGFLCLPLSACGFPSGSDKDLIQQTNSSSSTIASSTSSSESQSNLSPVEQLDNCIQKDLRYAQGEYPHDKIETYKKEFERVFENSPNSKLGDYGTDFGYQCPFGDKKLITFFYVAKGSETFFNHYSRAKYTVFALINDQDKIVDSVKVECPLVDDIGPAYMLATKENQLLTGCFTGGAGGQSIFDFQVIDLNTFSSKLVYRESYLRQNPEDVTKLDKTDTIPIEFKERINFAMDFWKN